MSTVVLWVSDINREANFYSALLDAPLADQSAEFCAVRNEKNSVLLHLLPEQYRVPTGSLLPAQEEVAIKPVFAVASIETATARAASHEIRIMGDVKTYGDVSYLDCVDPEGNVIQISATTTD
jgi:predicted enzyme related to lactoylglutathione lyase